MSNARPLFREEALQRHLGGEREGDLLRIPTHWSRWVLPLIIAVVVAGIAFCWWAELPTEQLTRGRYQVAVAEAGSSTHEVALAAEVPLVRAGDLLGIGALLAASPGSADGEVRALEAGQVRSIEGRTVAVSSFPPAFTIETHWPAAWVAPPVVGAAVTTQFPSWDRRQLSAHVVAVEGTAVVLQIDGTAIAPLLAGQVIAPRGEVELVLIGRRRLLDQLLARFGRGR